MMPRDAEAVKDASLARDTARRVWGFARPYRGTIALFLLAIVAAALLALVPPLVVRRIIDVAIPNAIDDGNRSPIWWLAGLAVAAALVDAGLQIVQRWCSARVGEGLIADLRRSLYTKVQRLPIAFFTRTPTGAITSRLNNDVVGAQTAVTSTLGSVVSNVIVLVTTLVAMLALEWRLTILALIVLPLFIVPARRVGRRLQSISRDQMQHNAAMNTQMTERFNVSGAVLVKLFGSLERESRARSAPAPTPFATRASGPRCWAVSSSWRSGPRRRGRHRRDLRHRRAARGERRHHGRHAGRTRRAGHPDLPAAHRPHQRPRRPDDVDGLVRAGVRGARRSRADLRQAVGAYDAGRPARAASSSVDVTFRYPVRRSSRRSRRWRRRPIPGADPDRDVLSHLSLTLERGRDRRARRRVGCRQEHPRVTDPAPLRRHRGCRCASTATTCAT